MSISDILSVAGVIGVVVLWVAYVGFAILLEWRYGGCGTEDSDDDLRLDEGSRL